MFTPQTSSFIPSGQRLSPLALIDLCKTKKDLSHRPKSTSPNESNNISKITSSGKGFNWQRVSVTPPNIQINNFTTPKSSRQYFRNNSSHQESKKRRQCYESVIEADSNMIFEHNVYSTARPNNKFQTPPRSNYVNLQLRRQQSASATLVGGNGRIYLQCNQKTMKESQSAYNLGRPASYFPSRNKSTFFYIRFKYKISV